jgi:hypothetical protein
MAMPNLKPTARPGGTARRTVTSLAGTVSEALIRNGFATPVTPQSFTDEGNATALLRSFGAPQGMEHAFMLRYMRENSGDNTLYPGSIQPAAATLAKQLAQTPTVLTDLAAFAPDDVGIKGAGAFLILLSQFVAASNSDPSTPRKWFTAVAHPQLGGGATQHDKFVDSVIRAAGYQVLLPPPGDDESVVEVPPVAIGLAENAKEKGRQTMEGYQSLSDHTHLSLAAGITARVYGSDAFRSAAIPLEMGLDLANQWLNAMRRSTQVTKLLPAIFNLFETEVDTFTQGREPGDTKAINLALREYRAELAAGNTADAHPATFLALLEEVPSLVGAVNDVNKRWDAEAAANKRNKRLKRGYAQIDDFDDFVDRWEQKTKHARDDSPPSGGGGGGGGSRGNGNDRKKGTGQSALRQLRQLLVAKFGRDNYNEGIRRTLAGACPVCQGPVSRDKGMKCGKTACLTGKAADVYVQKIAAATTVANL